MLQRIKDTIINKIAVGELNERFTKDLNKRVLAYNTTKKDDAKFREELRMISYYLTGDANLSNEYLQRLLEDMSAELAYTIDEEEEMDLSVLYFLRSKAFRNIPKIRKIREAFEGYTIFATNNELVGTIVNKITGIRVISLDKVETELYYGDKIVVDVTKGGRGQFGNKVTYVNRTHLSLSKECYDEIEYEWVNEDGTPVVIDEKYAKAVTQSVSNVVNHEVEGNVIRVNFGK